MCTIQKAKVILTGINMLPSPLMQRVGSWRPVAARSPSPTSCTEVGHAPPADGQCVAMGSSAVAMTTGAIVAVVFPNWERTTQKLTQRGSPLVLLVGSAALRILELTRFVM